MKDRFVPVLDIGLGWWKIYDRKEERAIASVYDQRERPAYARDMAHHICKFLNTEED